MPLGLPFSSLGLGLLIEQNQPCACADRMPFGLETACGWLLVKDLGNALIRRYSHSKAKPENMEGTRQVAYRMALEEPSHLFPFEAF